MTDFVGIHQRFIENALSHLLWHEDVRIQVGLNGASQIWTEPPAWYFWLNGVKGAYLLRLIEVEIWDGLGFGTYLVHFFPHPNASRGDWTEREMELLSGHCFDPETATPHYEHFSEFSDVFVLGEVGAVLDEAGRPGLIFCSTDNQEEKKMDAFVDLLVSMADFQLKTHPEAVYMHFPAGQAKSTMIVFDDRIFSKFTDDYDIRQDELTRIESDRLNEQWFSLAHLEAKSKLGSLCGCSC